MEENNMKKILSLGAAAAVLNGAGAVDAAHAAGILTRKVGIHDRYVLNDSTYAAGRVKHPKQPSVFRIRAVQAGDGMVLTVKGTNVLFPAISDEANGRPDFEGIAVRRKATIRVQYTGVHCDVRRKHGVLGASRHSVLTIDKGRKPVQVIRAGNLPDTL